MNYHLAASAFGTKTLCGLAAPPNAEEPLSFSWDDPAACAACIAKRREIEPTFVKIFRFASEPPAPAPPTFPPAEAPTSPDPPRKIRKRSEIQRSERK